MERLELSPTAYEVERRRQAAQSPKRFKREGQRQLKIAISDYMMAYRNGTAGMQYSRLLHLRAVANEYGIELDVYFKWMIAVHEAGQGES